MTGILGAAGTYAFTPAAVISLSNQEIFNAAAGTATAIYAINSNGSVQDQDSGTLENWLVGSGTNSNYEVRATLVSGVVTGASTGSWLNCGTTRSWSRSNGAMDNSTLTSVLFVEIRLASSGVVQDSATITLRAESDNFS
jgi:hypothetical protein